jgi:hypothetical protein
MGDSPSCVINHIDIFREQVFFIIWSNHGKHIPMSRVLKNQGFWQTQFRAKIRDIGCNFEVTSCQRSTLIAAPGSHWSRWFRSKPFRHVCEAAIHTEICPAFSFSKMNGVPLTIPKNLHSNVMAGWIEFLHKYPRVLE